MTQGEAEGVGFDISAEHRRIAAAIPADGHNKPKLTPVQIAHEGFRAAVRAQILAFCEGDINSKTLGHLQRFCASAGQAMVPMEAPDQLVRSRFGATNQSVFQNPGVDLSYSPDDGLTLQSAPFDETYATNTSRGIIESAMKIGKEFIQAQADVRTKPVPPTMIELISSLSIAKTMNAPKSVIKSLEKQLEAAASEPVSGLAGAIPALPARKPSRRKRA